MKKVILVFVCLLAYAGVYAQEDAISKYFGEYEDRDDFTTIIITSRMFGLLAQIPESEDEEDVMNVIRKLNGLKIITSDDYGGRAELFRNAYKKLTASGFDELMIIKEGDEQIYFLIEEKKGKISEFVMIIGGDDEFLLMSMTGDLDLKDIARLSETMDIDGFEHLDKIDEQ